jgi:hypothetical protein
MRTLRNYLRPRHAAGNAQSDALLTDRASGRSRQGSRPVPCGSCSGPRPSRTRRRGQPPETGARGPRAAATSAGIVEGSMAASIAQTWTTLPAICRTGASGMAGPAKVSPVSSMNSRCAAPRRSSSRSTSPLAPDMTRHERPCSPRTDRPDEQGRPPAVRRAGGKEADLPSSSVLNHHDPWPRERGA